MAEPCANCLRLTAAIREALAFEAMLPAIATTPRRVLSDAIKQSELETENAA